uniref:Astacin domain-containing protein n=1 Tax=Panagrolaimus superbus TaxID=310955 RepID=A0A914XTJ3_9BILA
MKMQHLLFAVVFAVSCIDFSSCYVAKIDKLERAKELFRNVLPPNEVEGIANRLQKLKNLHQKNSSRSSSASFVNTIIPTNVAKKGPIIDGLELRPNEINDNLGLDNVLYAGDILLTIEQLDHLIAIEEETQETSRREKRQAISINDEVFYRIFNKTKPIFYVFNESFSNPNHLQLFHDAMNYINSYTCLNITEGIGLNFPTGDTIPVDQIIDIRTRMLQQSRIRGYVLYNSTKAFNWSWMWKL